MRREIYSIYARPQAEDNNYGTCYIDPIPDHTIVG